MNSTNVSNIHLRSTGQTRSTRPPLAALERNLTTRELCNISIVKQTSNSLYFLTSWYHRSREFSHNGGAFFSHIKLLQLENKSVHELLVSPQSQHVVHPGEKSHENHPKRFSNIWSQGRRAFRLRTAGSRCRPSTRSGFLRVVMRARSGGGAWRARSAGLFRWEPVSREHWRLASACTTSGHTPPSSSWSTETRKHKLISGFLT